VCLKKSRNLESGSYVQTFATGFSQRDWERQGYVASSNLKVGIDLEELYEYELIESKECVTVRCAVCERYRLSLWVARKEMAEEENVGESRRKALVKFVMIVEKSERDWWSWPGWRDVGFNLVCFRVLRGSRSC
jgi:hypothetical protein